MKKLLPVLIFVFSLLTLNPAQAADFTKGSFTLISHQAVAGDSSLIGTALNVDGYLYGSIYIFDSPVESNDPTSAVIYEIQTIGSSGGNDGWSTVWSFSTNLDAPATEAVAANTSSNIFSVASTVGFEVGGWVYVQDANTIGSGDWDKIQAVDSSGPNYITINDTVNYPKDSSDVLWEADVPAPIYVDLGGVKRIRVNIYNQMATDNDHHVWVKLEAVTAIEQ